MANIELLKAKIDESGMTIPVVAERAGMEDHTLHRRLDGKGDFRATEIVGLSKALKLKVSERNEIFLK